MDREAGNGSGPAEADTKATAVEAAEETVEMAAQRFLTKVRERLAAGVARREEHRMALEAVVLLPEPTAWRWLEELRFAFAYVYASDRDTPPLRSDAHHESDGVPEACESGV